jgi:SOS regulatory protein LexA
MLTVRQKQIRDFVTKTITRNGVAPSEREVARHFRISASTTHEHLETLKEKGYLQKDPRRARGIKVTEPVINLVQIPLLGTISAGQPITLFDVPKETMVIPKSKIPPSSEVYALRVVGNSMTDENIKDGDIILVKQQEVANNGQRVIALIDNYEATLKKFYKEHNQIRLQPANNAYEPIIIKKTGI